VPEFSGTIEHVGLKTTRIRAQAGEQIVIANTELLRKVVHNFKRQSTRRVQYALRIDPSTRRPTWRHRCRSVSAPSSRRARKVAFDHVNLVAMNQDYLEYDIVYKMLEADYGLFLKTQQAVLLETMQALRELGISTAPRVQRMMLQDGAERQPANDAGAKEEARGKLLVKPVH
jgi:hypothetical protein